MSIQRTASRIAVPFEQLFKRYALSEAMYNALRIINAGGARGRMCNEISHDLVSRVPDVTRLVDRLEKAGLATRDRSATDRRAVFVKATKRGSDLLRKMDAEVQEAHTRVLGHMNHADLTRLCDLLAQARHPQVDPQPT